MACLSLGVRIFVVCFCHFVASGDDVIRGTYHAWWVILPLPIGVVRNMVQCKYIYRLEWVFLDTKTLLWYSYGQRIFSSDCRTCNQHAVVRGPYVKKTLHIECFVQGLAKFDAVCDSKEEDFCFWCILTLSELFHVEIILDIYYMF